jgi:hypothetical protein
MAHTIYPDPERRTIRIELRKQRDMKIKETDWWALKDNPEMTDAQITYRQALRDITDTYDSIDDVVWPTKPE